MTPGLIAVTPGSLVSGPVTFGDVALSLCLVGVAVGVSAWQRLGLEGDLTVATLRSFVQLIAVGYVLAFVFAGHGWLTVLALTVMVGTASLTTRNRARRVPGSGGVAVAAIGTATLATLGLLVALRIIPTSARAIIPLGSMIIAGAMNTASLVMTRLHDDLATNRREVEARLCLGQTAHEAALPWLRSAIRGGMLPSVDSTKVVGLVALPGAMTGLILAGVSPLSAVRLQLVVMYMLLGGTAFAALVAAQLTVGKLFTRSHQLIKALRRIP
jgi:putative ABC transport system permease protein